MHFMHRWSAPTTHAAPHHNWAPWVIIVISHRIFGSFWNLSLFGPELERWAIVANAHHGHALIWLSMSRFCACPPRLRGRLHCIIHGHRVYIHFAVSSRKILVFFSFFFREVRPDNTERAFQVMRGTQNGTQYI